VVTKYQEGIKHFLKLCCLGFAFLVFPNTMLYSVKRTLLFVSQESLHVKKLLMVLKIAHFFLWINRDVLFFLFLMK